MFYIYLVLQFLNKFYKNTFEQELIELRNENRYLKGQFDDIHSEKIKRAHHVKI